jgi:hypothetical protein
MCETLKFISRFMVFRILSIIITIRKLANFYFMSHEYKTATKDMDPQKNFHATMYVFWHDGTISHYTSYSLFHYTLARNNVELEKFSLFIPTPAPLLLS